MTVAGAAAEQRAADPHPHPVHLCAHHLQETGGDQVAAGAVGGRAIVKDATTAMEAATTVGTIAMTIVTPM